MISMLRIDERLIHGQIAMAWSKSLAVSHIVVVNDWVAGSEVQKAALKMASPANVKFAIRDIKGGVELLNDDRSKSLNILVVVKNVQDAKKVVDAVSDIKVVNLGNIGCIDYRQGSKEFSSHVKLTEEEIQELRLINEKVPVELQLIPEHPIKEFSKLLKGE